ERAEQRFSFGGRLPLNRARHQRRGRLTDGAPRALEADLADDVTVHADLKADAVAAQRVVALRGAIGPGDRPEVPRVPVVLEDGLLVQVAEVAHRSPKRSRTIRSSCARNGAISIRPRISAAKP